MGTSRKQISVIRQRLLSIWPFLFIVSVWFIFASPYFLKGLIPLPSKYLVTFFPPWNAQYGMALKNNAMPDVVTQIYPWKKLTIDTWKHGEIPLWNPYSFSGTPHAANYQTAVFSPFNILFFLLPQVDAWSVLVLLQPLLAGIFMYIWLRQIERSKHASVLGSLAFMFCGFIVVWMAYATLAYAALWLPCLLYGIHKYIKKPSWWSGVVVCAGMALSLLSGHFQISFYVGVFSFSYLLYQIVQTRQWKRGISMGIFFILGILLAIPQLWLAFDAYLQSVRSSSFGSGEIIPWQYLITIIAPDFYGNPVTRNDWFGHYAEWSSYIGVVPFLFALYAVLRKKDAVTWFFFGSAGVALLLATPTFLIDLLFRAKIPAISTSAASRIIVLASFSLATLASQGLDGLIADWRTRERRFVIRLLLVISLFFIGAWFVITIGKPLPIDKLIIAKRNFLLPTLIGFSTGFLMLTGFLKRKYVQALVVILFLIITAYDMLRFSIKWMPFDPKEYVFPSMKVISFLQKEIGRYRVFGNFGNELATYFSIPSIEGYDALYQGRYGELITAASNGVINRPNRSVALLDKYGVRSEAVLQLLGVRYILHRLSDGQNVWAYPVWTYPYYRQIYRDEHYEVYENTRALPRVFLASSYIVATSDQKVIDTVFDPELNLRKTLVMEQKPHLEPVEGEGEATITEYRPTIVNVSVQSQTPKLLFLSDVFDSGWHAFIDNKETRIYRANYDFRAVAIPEGSHTVRFVYRPKSVIFGLYIVLAVVTLLLAGSLKVIFYGDRHI